MLKGTTFVFRTICDLLRAEGVEYNRHPTTDRISWVLVEMLYSDTNDIDFAYEILAQHKKSNRACIPTNKENERQAGPPAQDYPAQGYSAGRRDVEPRTAYKMAFRFKNHDKCTGKLGEDLTEQIKNYIDAAQDYGIDQTNNRAGQEVLLYQERSKEWIGPATITGVRDKIVDAVIIWILPVLCWSVREGVSTAAVNYNTTNLSRG